jgi:hypothetical protein
VGTCRDLQRHAPPDSQYIHSEKGPASGTSVEQRALTDLEGKVERRHQGDGAIRPAQPVRHLPVVVAWVREATCQESNLRRGLA